MKKSTLFLILGNIGALILGFVGAPKMSLVTGIIAFLIFTAFYWLAVYYIKKFSAKP